MKLIEKKGFSLCSSDLSKALMESKTFKIEFLIVRNFKLNSSFSLKNYIAFLKIGMISRKIIKKLVTVIIVSTSDQRYIIIHVKLSDH